MTSQHVEGAIAVKDGGKPAELGLVGGGLHDPTPREAINQERRHPELAKVFRPELLSRAYASRAMKQDDGGQPSRYAPWEAQFPRNRDPLAILVASQELLIAQRERLNCMQLGTRGEVAHGRLSEG